MITIEQHKGVNVLRDDLLTGGTKSILMPSIIGYWSLDGEPKHVRTKPKKVSRSFTESEIEMFNYFMKKIADNVQLDASDLDNQVYRDNGDILIQFSRDRIEDVRSLLNKFQNG